MLSRSLPRFLLQAGLLIGAAVVAAILHLGALLIVVVMAAAFGAVVVAEWVATRDRGAGPERADAVPAKPEPMREPVPLVHPDRTRARGIAGRDPARDEAFSFLLLYLREFADISGDLSEDFDIVVRESFPELISQ